MKINTHTLINTYDNLNKDSLLVKNNWFTVADGVSSHGKAGAIAAQIATDRVKLFDLNNLKCKSDVKDFMFQLDNEISLTTKGCTTFTSAFIKNNKLVLMHSGDSECYLVYEDRLKEITKPFTMTYAAFLRGDLKESEIKRGRYSNILTECLGEYSLKNPQIEVFDLKGVKGLILCSDGANHVYPEYMLEIFRLFGKGSAERICEESRNLGSNDDITVICVEF